MQEIAELHAPPEVLQALRDGRRSGIWIRAKCPFCDPGGHKSRNLAASHTGFGRNRDRPGWLCHRCHAEEDLRSARQSKGKIRYDPNAAKNDEKRRRAAAQSIIEQSRSIDDGDPVDLYLRGRRLVPPGAFWPPSLRKAYLRHPETGKTRHPVMVGIVTDSTNVAAAVHRTYVTDEGLKAQLTPNRLALGPITGCAIRLGVDSSTIIVAEGIESALGAAMYIEGGVPWAAISAGNMARLSIPRSVTHVKIAPDRDANNVGRRAAMSLRKRIKDLQISQNRKIDVEIIPPPRGRSDFADFD